MDGLRLDEAMERYAGGDDAAFREVYDGLVVILLPWVFHRLGDYMRAEDIIQQTLFALHRARGSFLRGAPVLPWAIGVAKHLMVDEWRRQKRNRRWDRVDPDTWLARPPRPDEEAAARELAASLQAAFDALPDSQKTVLALREEGRSQAEMARALATTVAAVKLRIHRAALALRGVLVEKELPP